jgi:hypothetical protein
MKTSELIGAALDWAVAKAEGGTNFWSDGIDTHWVKLRGEDRALSGGWAQAYLPSANWAQGGPIIDKEEIDTVKVGVKQWRGRIEGGNPVSGYGPSPLIAAMRCYVVSKLGDEIEIPDVLK